LKPLNICNGKWNRSLYTYWNPTCECRTSSEQRTASVTGLRDPAAKGAMVRGIRPTATSL
jgi:hypothetical protein